MNTNEIKGKLWNICIEKGLFQKVKGEQFRDIQQLFEKIIKSYETLEPSQEIFDKVIDSLALEIQNGFKPKFEDIEKEYNALLNPSEPKKIDFTKDFEFNTLKPNVSVNLEEVIMTQNKILIQILETQMKILDRLK